MIASVGRDFSCGGDKEKKQSQIDRGEYRDPVQSPPITEPLEDFGQLWEHIHGSRLTDQNESGQGRIDWIVVPS